MSHYLKKLYIGLNTLDKDWLGFPELFEEILFYTKEIYYWIRSYIKNYAGVQPRYLSRFYYYEPDHVLLHSVFELVGRQVEGNMQNDPSFMNDPELMETVFWKAQKRFFELWNWWKETYVPLVEEIGINQLVPKGTPYRNKRILALYDKYEREAEEKLKEIIELRQFMWY